MKLKSRRRGRPKTNNTQRDSNVILNLDNKLLLQYQIKECSVKLTPINIEQSAMDETSPAPVAPKRRGRKPKNPLAAKPAVTPAKTVATDGSTKPEQKNDEKSETNADESIEKVEKTPKLSLSERKLAKKAETEAIIASGGRGKRTPKPNPKYMDEPVVSANKHGKDEFDLENVEGEDGDDEMNQSSDEPRNEGPLKKRMLQKVGIRSGPGRKPGSGKGTPGRKPAGVVAYKRKLDVDIDIDDEHGKQLFLDAKRRFQNVSIALDLHIYRIHEHLFSLVVYQFKIFVNRQISIFIMTFSEVICQWFFFHLTLNLKADSISPVKLLKVNDFSNLAESLIIHSTQYFQFFLIIISFDSLPRAAMKTHNLRRVQVQSQMHWRRNCVLNILMNSL